MIDKRVYKYTTNIEPKTPKFNAFIKTHKKNEPIRPVVNNAQAPSYNIAKYLNKSLNKFTT